MDISSPTVARGLRHFPISFTPDCSKKGYFQTSTCMRGYVPFAPPQVRCVVVAVVVCECLMYIHHLLLMVAPLRVLPVPSSRPRSTLEIIYLVSSPAQTRAQRFSGSLSAVCRREKLWDHGISLNIL